jgi:hypothetical protein
MLGVLEASTLESVIFSTLMILEGTLNNNPYKK